MLGWVRAGEGGDDDCGNDDGGDREEDVADGRAVALLALRDPFASEHHGDERRERDRRGGFAERVGLRELKDRH